MGKLNKSAFLLSMFIFLFAVSYQYFPISVWNKRVPATSEIKRKIASEKTLTYKDLLTIKTYTNAEKDPNAINKLIARIKPYVDMNKGILFEFIEDDKMLGDEAYKVLPVIENQNYIIKIFFSNAGKADLDAAEELYRFLEKSLVYKFTHPTSFFELYYNVKAGDVTSLHILSKLREEALERKESHSGIGKDGFIERSEEQFNHWQNAREQFGAQELEHQDAIKAKIEARNNAISILDNLSEDEQFNNLVAKNDRKGVAALIRKYLPWEQMPPFEKAFWENHLQVMANPLPLQDRILLYRGVDNDIHLAKDIGENLTVDEAIHEQKIFMMSKSLTKSKGTWNSRLRSLTAMYEKYMATDFDNSSKMTKGARISTMFMKHSVNSRNGNEALFLSYTSNFEVAAGFGPNRLTAYLIDPRMIYFNQAALYPEEAEFLLPLVNFPDDLGAIYDAKVHPDVTDKQSFLKETIIKRLDKDLGNGNGGKAYARIQLNSKNLIKPEIGTSTKFADGNVARIFGGVVRMPEVKGKVSQGNGGTSCQQLVQAFL